VDLPFPLPEGFISAYDVDKQRERIFERILQAVQKTFPIQNKQYRLHLEDLAYEGPEHYDLAAQKAAILEGRTLGRRLRGRWVLSDTSGNILDSKHQTLAVVPYLTPKGAFILDGVSYTLGHQFRLRPGIYVRKRQSGEVSAYVNTPGKAHQYLLDPKSGQFYILLGQAKLPLAPLLEALGAKEDEIRAHWGNEIWKSHQKQRTPTNLQRLYRRFLKARAQPNASLAEQGRALTELFHSLPLDPEITSYTLGRPFSKLDKDAILTATNKILRVARGEETPDDRDNIAFQTVWGPADLLAEAIHSKSPELRKAFWRASNRRSLERWPSGILNKLLRSVLQKSGLGQPLEEVNALELLDQQGRVSKTGAGALTSTDKAPLESRGVHPSQFGYVDIIRTPESGKAGLDLRLATHAIIGPDQRLYTLYKDRKTGKWHLLSAQEASMLPVAFPNETNKDHILTIQRGKTRYLPEQEVRWELPFMETTFSPISNLVPLKSMAKGQRVNMGSRFFTQALPLARPEAPLVQNALPYDPQRSYEELWGTKLGAIYAEHPGVITAIGPDFIQVRGPDKKDHVYEIYNNFPTNRKTLFHSTPVVKVGDRVSPGQLLARSNFTDEKGTMALGANARVAYLPFRGLNYEDAIVISQDFAKKLTSEHAYQFHHEWDENDRPGKKYFHTLFPKLYDRRQLSQIDDQGIIRPGSVVKQGDPLVLVARGQNPLPGRLYRPHRGSFRNASLVWDNQDDGIVTDVVSGPKGTKIVVKSYQPMRQADKLSGRYGNKGVVHIIPTEEMPRDEEGRPLEVLLDPLGVISRTNPAQLAEALLGKVAAKRGTPYKVVDFDQKPNRLAWALEEARKYGVKDTETLTDPVTGRKIPNVLTGVSYFLKLMHTAEAKSVARSLGAYTAEGAPARGNIPGGHAMRLGLMDTSALLAHGATQVLRDAKLIRGQKNQEYWNAIMNGQPPPEPAAPMVYRKFLNELAGAGVYVQRQGPRLTLRALTDKDIDTLAGNRNLRNAETVQWKNGLEPISGGLFDPELTGGHGNEQRWSAIALAEPLPNPSFLPAIRSVLGLTQKELEEIYAGRKPLHGRTGPGALEKALAEIDLPRAIEETKQQIKNSRGQGRDQAIRRLVALLGAQKQGTHPRDWMLHRFPVLPPAFRPVSLLPNKKDPVVADVNLLYKELFQANQVLQELKKHTHDVGDERLNLLRAATAVSGLEDPVTGGPTSRPLEGLLAQIFSKRPKFGTVQQKLLSTTTDLVGRAVIVPDPDLGIDQVGLPETYAWELYKPFIIGNLVRRGMSRIQALEELQKQSRTARQALLEELQKHPLLVDRAPVLHKYGILAFQPILVAGHQFRLPPLVYKGYGADNDGDQMNFHVIADPKAVEEARAKLLPSRNLFSSADFRRPMLVPSQQYLAGLFYATSPGKGPVRTYATVEDVLRALRRGEISPQQRVHVLQDHPASKNERKK
jgi:DNA-directed RNA polymerase beta subunit